MCILQFFFANIATFLQLQKFMRIYSTIIAFFILLLTVSTYAGPVRESSAVYYQPDGSSFNVNITGDEWIKIRTTEDGCAITIDKDGWWCYATYDHEGKISSTGYHVGKAPAHILSASRNIPYRLLSQNAAKKRAVNTDTGLQTLEKIRQQVVMTRSGSTKFQKRGLALLVQFNDVKFTYTKADFINLLNQNNYNGTGSAKDYYEYQFGEGWEFNFDVSDIITLDYPSEHYGANDENGQDIRPWDMVAEACQLADSQIDFSLYDQDEDGWVDNVYVFYAGLSESENTSQTNLIWPHQYSIYAGASKKPLTLDGKNIDRYACSSEISGIRSLTGIGSFCHEYGHTFGLKDLYDTDYDDKGGWAPGTWRYTSLMDGGNYNNNSATPPNFNCIEREMLGLSQAKELEAGKSYTLEPIHLNGSFYRLDTETAGEYYLFECRSNDNWDEYIGGKGMLVYHIDKNLKTTIGSYSYNAWDQNQVNCVLEHQGADLIEADGRSEVIASMSDLKKNISGIFFPTIRVTSIGTDGAPQLKYWNGNSSNLAITGIKRSGSNIVFGVMDKSYVPGVPRVTNVEFTTFPDAAVITFDSSDPTITDAKAVLEWKISDTDYKTIYPTHLGNGKYACKIDGLASGNVTYETSIHFETEVAISASYKLAFMTKRKPSVDWPYFYISDAAVKVADGLILHIVNSVKAAEISWSYNGSAITPEKDFRFRPSQDGTLKAVISWPDGSSDTITKKLTVLP